MGASLVGIKARHFFYKMNTNGPRTEFSQALRALASERGLDPNVIIEAIKQAIITAYKKDSKERGEEPDGFDYDVELNSSNGEARIFSWPLPPEEETDDTDTDIDKDKNKDKDNEKTPKAVIAPEDKKDVTPPGFGRIAARAAGQVIHQKIREAEKGIVMEEYEAKVGSLVSGLILRFEGSDVRIDLNNKAEGIMISEERIPNERLNLSQKMLFLLKNFADTPKGKQIILSRADPVFVQKLFEREVPEMSTGSVEVRAIVREPGVRTKMAVYSKQSGVDPVGSCVGQKGVRVQAVTNELGGERVDIIQWSDNIQDLIKTSLAPAEDLTVTLDEDKKIAIVDAPEDQLSLAIGREGQNARLAAKLTGWRIEIKETKIKKEKETEKDIVKEKTEKVKTEKKVKEKKEVEKTSKEEKTDNGSK